MHAKRFLILGTRLGLVAAAAFSLAACDVVVSSMNANAKAQEEWSKSFPIAENGRLEVSNTNGVIEILATDSQRIEVRAERVARGNTEEAARELLKQVQIKETVAPDAVKLETVLPSSAGFGRGGEVRYYLKVPAGLSVTLHNTNGQIRIDGVRGDVRAETTNGGIRGRGLSGAVDASSTNGGVQLDMTALAGGGIKAETTNGGVQLVVPENVKAELEAKTVHGGVSITGLTVDGQSSRTHVEGRVNGGGPRIALETTNGGITVRAGASAAK